MKHTALNLRHVRVFCETCDAGGVTAAAARVHLSQPAVTQAVTKLETIFGERLLTRSSAGVHPTEAGDIVRARAERALALIAEGAAAAEASDRARPRSADCGFHRAVTARQLNALIAVGAHGGFSLAAARIGLSQPAVHRAARDLERLAGAPLFRRTPEGVGLTRAGAELARCARLAYAELASAFEEIAAHQGVGSARVVVGTLPLARSQVLPAAIDAFTRRLSEAQVSVVDGPYDTLLHALRHGEVDLMIGALRDPAPADDVVEETLFHDTLALFARAAHPLVGAAAIRAADFVRYPWIAPRGGTLTRRHFDSLFTAEGLDPPTRLIEASSLVLTRELLLCADRLTLISPQQLRDEEATGQVRRLPFDLAHTARPIGLTTRRNWRPTAAQAALVDELRAASAALPAA